MLRNDRVSLLLNIMLSALLHDCISTPTICVFCGARQLHIAIAKKSATIRNPIFITLLLLWLVVVTLVSFVVAVMVALLTALALLATLLSRLSTLTSILRSLTLVFRLSSLV